MTGFRWAKSNQISLEPFFGNIFTQSRSSLQYQGSLITQATRSTHLITGHWEAQTQAIVPLHKKRSGITIIGVRDPGMKNQTLKTNIIFAVLVLGFYALTFLEDSPASTHILRFITLILAGGFSAGYLFSLSKAIGFDLETNDFDKVEESPIPFFASAISIIAMLGMGLILLISYLIKKELLFSLNYLWIPMMIAPLAWLLKSFLTNHKEQRDLEDSLVPYYHDNPDVLSLWAFTLYQQIEKGDSACTLMKNNQLYRQVADRCNGMISQSSYILYDHDLMDQTEALMVALVRGEPISIVVPAVYDQRTLLIETAQKLYFYYVNEMNRPIHHEIREKISGY